MSETIIRLSVFLGMLIAMSAMEALWPKRARVQSRLRRWTANLGLVVLDTLALRVLFPIIAVGVAVWAQAQGFGLLNWIDAPIWVEVIAAILVLDLAIYGQHVATHRVPTLWRLHKVHHTDRDLDATTALRFHPLEIIASMAYKMGVVALLGPAFVAVIAFEILLNACAIFNHANIGLPPKLDRALRAIVVTPDMHRIHHSVREDETNSNYGTSLSIWDHLFRTYRSRATGELVLGLSEYQPDAPSHLGWSLKLPFIRR